MHDKVSNLLEILLVYLAWKKLDRSFPLSTEQKEPVLRY